jgi:DNA-binding SARP family transcriptional activator
MATTWENPRMARSLFEPEPRVVGDGLDIRLLGGVQVRVGGEQTETLRSGRARSLLAYLVLHQEVAHPRQRLAFLFWPDSSEAQARTNLRNVLHTLRQVHPSVDACLDVTTTMMQWRPSEGVTVDADRFVDAVDAAASADPDDAYELIARCRAAAALYAGDLVDGDDDDWLFPRRDSLRDRYRLVLRMLATALIDDGTPLEATSVARDLVRADPFDESAHRLRMEAHQAAGDRAGAVRAFHECVATFDRELGFEPGADTMALYASLIEHPHPLVPEPGRRPVRARPGLVGRDDEWRRLTAAWEAAQHGPPAAVLVTGEAGIGKTKIIDELCAWCAVAGAAVGEARSYVTEGDLGYAVVASWLRCPDIEAGLRDVSVGERAELARVLPELGAPVAADEVGDAERRRRLFDAAVSALTATGRPTLLVADDAQWSDPASQELIHYLLRQRAGAPLLVVLTARHDDLDAVHPLTALRDELTALDRVIEVNLGRLPRDETAALGRQLLGTPLDEGAVDALFAESEGNPLFVVETVRAGWDGSSGSMPLSPKLRAVIDSRLRRLSELAMTIARTMAVVGRPCSAGLLRRFTGLEDMALAQGLDELWRRGVLCESGANSYEFSHGKLRDVTYEELSPALRSALHGAVGDALADLARHDPDLSASQVAVHLEAAQRVEEAVTWFQEAALEARQMFAHAEAVRLIDRALALVPALPAEVRHVRELELLSTMPAALAGVDGYDTDRMSKAQQRAVRVADDLGVALDPAFVRSMVMSALCRDEFGDATRSAEDLLAHAAATGDTGLRLESHYLLGIAAFWAADLDRAREHFETVVAEFDPSMRPRHHVVFGHDAQVVCLSRLANTMWFLGREDDAREACDDAVALAVSVGHPWSHDTAVFWGTVLALELGDQERLRHSTAQLGTMDTGSAPNTLKLEALRGVVAVLDGDALSIARVRAALDGCDGRNFFPGFQACIMRLLLAACALAGNAVEGIDACTRALAMGGTPLWKPEAHRLRAEFLHQSGAELGAVTEDLDAAEAAARLHGADGQLRRIEATRARVVASAPTV